VREEFFDNSEPSKLLTDTVPPLPLTADRGNDVPLIPTRFRRGLTKQNISLHIIK
jgi:hypothetical protein